MANLELLLEAERRGILPEGKRVLLDEARKRGLLGRSEQQDDGGAMRAVQDFSLAATEGLTSGFLPEIAGAAKTALNERPFDENRSAVAERLNQVSPGMRFGGNLLGGAVTGGAGAVRAAALPGIRALPNAAKFGAIGAVEGALAGAGFAGPGNRGSGAAQGTITGAATGAAVPLAMRTVQRIKGFRQKEGIPTSDELRAQARAAYGEAENAGVVVTDIAFRGAVNKIDDTLVNAGFNARIHPKVSAAVDEIKETMGGPVTLEKIEQLRRIAKSAGKSVEPDERRVGGILEGAIDDFVEGLKPSQLIAGDAPAAIRALGEARQLWARVRKGETIDELIDRAGVRASQFSGSGFENALRTEFRNLALNPKRMRTFSRAEQKAIRGVAQGGPIANALRTVGKLAPTGIVSGALSSGTGFVVGGPVGAVALPMLGGAARFGATQMGIRRAHDAADIMRRGGPRRLPELSEAEKRIALSLLLSGGQRGQNRLPPAIPTPFGNLPIGS